MTIEPAKVRDARRQVAATREALLDTLTELKERLAPKTLASEAWEKAKVKTADLAEDAVDAVKARPLAVGGAIAALTMFLAREPIADGARNLYDAMTSKKDGPAKPAAPRKPPVRKAPARRPAARPAKSKE